MGNKLFRDQSVWGGIHGSWEVLDMKNEEYKVEVPSETPWGAVPSKAPQGRLSLIEPGAPRQQERKIPGSDRQVLQTP